MFSDKDIIQTKENIAARVFRTAARLWGYNDASYDSFDPLVKLIIEACAVEFFRLDNELINLQRNVTEKLANQLLPEVYTEVRPAHCVIHATPTDDIVDVTLDSQFLYQKKVASVLNGPLDKSLDIFFAPAGRYKVFNADIQTLVVDKNVFNLTRQQKELNFVFNSYKAEANSIWVGLKVEQDEEIDLGFLSFFMDFKNTPDKFKLLPSLKFTRVKFNGHEIQVKPGAFRLMEEEKMNKFEYEFEELFISSRIEKEVQQIYTDHFIHLPEKDKLPLLKKSDFSYYPKEWEGQVANNELTAFDRKLLWLKLTLPPVFNKEVLEDLSISINCFPVINKRLNRLTHNLNSYFNIVPLLSQEQFLDIYSVKGYSYSTQTQVDYQFYPFDNYSEEEQGTYMIRNSNIHRFDNRNATESINYLIEVLRDESRAFAAFGQDFVSSTLKVLNQNIELIATKLKQNADVLLHSTSYLLVNPIKGTDNLEIQFWSCNGKMANGIKSHSDFILYDGGSFKKESIISLTQASGGKDKLNNVEVLNAFKSVLLSRNRLVTEMDVIHFCKYYLQGLCKEVQVSTTVALGSSPVQGYQRVILVKIELTDDNLSNEDKERIKNEMVNLLEEKSMINYKFKVELIKT